MTAPIRPVAAKTYGNEKWAFVPAVAAIATPHVAELTAAGSIDLSCFFYSDTTKPSVSQQGVSAPTRICDTQTFQSLGTAQWSGGDAKYAVDPQAAVGADGKKAYAALPEGTNGFLVSRDGIPYTTDFAAGQFVSIYPVEFGVPVVVTEGTGESAETAIQQAFVVTGPPAQIVVVAV